MTRKQRRLVMIGAGLTLLGASTALVLNAMSESIVFFQSPTDAVTKKLDNRRFRLGGLVEEGSVKRGEGTTVRFAVTDTKSSLPVVYTGLLPDLFREGQGVVAEGKMLPDGVFAADTVLAKHDENYMPPEVAESLKRQGVWRDTGQAPVGKETKPN